MIRRFLLAAAMAGISISAFAQAKLTVSASYARLEPKFQIDNPSAPLYMPSVFPMTSGDLGLFFRATAERAPGSAGATRFISSND
jgi:hypothetical protein